MIVYRLCKLAWQRDLSGKGAEITGGRWNSKGRALFYTSSSRALCMAEIAVHTPLGCLPADYVMIQIQIPTDIMVWEIQPDELPNNWFSFVNRQITQKIGDHFITRNEALVLKVPSAVVQGDYNYLINPFHSEIHRIHILGIESFRFDERLFGNR